MTGSPYRDLDHFDAHIDALCEQEYEARGDAWFDRFVRVRESAASASRHPLSGRAGRRKPVPTDSHRQTVAPPSSHHDADARAEVQGPRPERRPIAGAPHGDDPAGAHSGASAGEPLPQDQWPAFKVPTCECGCVLGDHRSVWVPAAVKPPAGTCLRCECDEFREKE